MYNDVDKQVVRIETGNSPAPRQHADAKVGTGFFVNNGDEIVTNSHVALSGSYTEVITSDGKIYHARLEKLDTADDLALFKVIGISADPKRAMQPDTTPLTGQEELLGYGHPSGADELWASPGHFHKQASFQDSLDPNVIYPDVDAIKKLEQSSDPTAASEAKQYLEAPRLEFIMNIQHGNSGSPVVDTNGHLRAVAADRISARHSLYIPAEKVQNLLSQPETRFQFNYQTGADGSQHLVSIGRLDGTTTPPIVLQMPK
jgi:S1-C subfamily serine protease